MLIYVTIHRNSNVCLIRSQADRADKEEAVYCLYSVILKLVCAQAIKPMIIQVKWIYKDVQFFTRLDCKYRFYQLLL